MVSIHRVGINLVLSLLWKYSEKYFSVNMWLVLFDSTGNISCEVSGEKKGRQGITTATKPPWEDMHLFWFSSSISCSTYNFQPGCENKDSLILFPPQKHLTARVIPVKLQSSEGGSDGKRAFFLILYKYQLPPLLQYWAIRADSCLMLQTYSSTLKLQISTF